jgi:hypothetical protein
MARPSLHLLTDRAHQSPHVEALAPHLRRALLRPRPEPLVPPLLPRLRTLRSPQLLLPRALPLLLPLVDLPEVEVGQLHQRVLEHKLLPLLQLLDLPVLPVPCLDHPPVLLLLPRPLSLLPLHYELSALHDRLAELLPAPLLLPLFPVLLLADLALLLLLQLGLRLLLPQEGLLHAPQYLRLKFLPLFY